MRATSASSTPCQASAVADAPIAAASDSHTGAPGGSRPRPVQAANISPPNSASSRVGSVAPPTQPQMMRAGIATIVATL